MAGLLTLCLLTPALRACFRLTSREAEPELTASSVAAALASSSGSEEGFTGQGRS